MATPQRIEPRIKFFLLGSASTLLVVALAATFLVRHNGVLKSKRVLFSPSANPAAQPARVAPSGQIEATQIPLANPDGVLPDQSERLQQPRWFFETFSETRLSRFLQTCGLTSFQRKVLLDKQFWQITPAGCTIMPPEPVIWFLSNESRRKIYSVLAKCPTNYAQCYPFRFLPETFATHLQQSGLSGPDIEKIRRLAYTNLGTVCFSDLAAARQMLSAPEFENLVEALYQTPAFVLRLRVTPDADIDALTKYWGKGGREKLIEPLLKALKRVPGGATINVNTLLPPFARIRLNTYPDSWNDPMASREDCFFTSMNFFNEKPDTNFLYAAYTKTILDSNYAPVESSPTYGDLIAVRNASGAIIHMCVYIAGDFVFTKNGINHSEPWVLMRMSDMLTVYDALTFSERMTIFRRKDAV